MELDFLDARDDINIVDSFVKANSVINNPRYKSIMCSISGGSDSDIMLDIMQRIDNEKKIKYVWFDTGLEYQATKEHLKYLEDKYGIEIIRERAIKPIPITCREYGQPFLNKIASEMMYRLQIHNFKWEDKSLDELLKEYPKCKSALEWWTNSKGNNSVLNIDHNKYLKEFILSNPPNFKISNKCCLYAQKEVSKQIIKKQKIDLSITGIRKAEGGARAAKIKNCYSVKEKQIDEYRPIFWYIKKNKQNYEVKFNIKHSACYSKYGLVRTGCCSCPYGRDFEKELKVTRFYEPKLYKAVCNVFKDSYEYTRRYKEFARIMKLKEDKSQISGQQTIFEYIKDC